MYPYTKERSSGIVDLVRQREIQDTTTHAVFRKLHVTENLILRLGLEKELNGHAGCVNCLEWNESGKLLASASDDMTVILWDPFRYNKKMVLRTGHQGNIFSVKFMPKSNDSILVSGAGDCKICIHDLPLKELIFACNCHTGRVKRLATATSIPYIFWSAAEDGTISQYDIREPHTCKVNNRTVLVQLFHHMGAYAEAKCIAVNQKRPELLAVGANDAYVRMYDRRMIKPTQVPQFVAPVASRGVRTNNETFRIGQGDPDDNIPLGCAQYFIAGHLSARQRNDNSRSLTTTYVTFSDDGNELLVNIGGEQVYLFDINSHETKSFQSPFMTNSEPYEWSQDVETSFENSEEINTSDSTDGPEKKNTQSLPNNVEELKQQANEAFERQKYTVAINLYNKGISYYPTAATLYANRAAALMKRGWDGDTYAALRDCQTTLLLDPDHVKAYFRLARCHFMLNLPLEAHRIMKDFLRKFPEYATNSACKALKMEIKEAVESDRDNPPSKSTFRISNHEQEWRRKAKDYKMRFCGHCNTTTDIKEVNFFGNTGQYIIAGSDDGSFFIWDRKTTNILRVLHGDERIVNCLQPHPYTCLLATSGIDPIIRLWSPRPEDGTVNEREVQDPEDAASANQVRMNSDPFELMLMNMGYRFPNQPLRIEEDEDSNVPFNCRPS